MKMFGKIFKYDFIYLIKRVWLYYAILFVSTGFTRLFIFLSESNVNSGALSFITVSLIAVVSIGIIGLFPFTVIMCLIRYSKGILKDEGYLTHTLPLGKHQLLVSKTITSVIILFISTIAAILSICILLLNPDVFKQLENFFYSIFSVSSKAQTIAVLSSVIFFAFSMSLLSVLGIERAMTQGSTFNKNKVILSILFAVALYVVYELAAYGITTAFNPLLTQTIILEEKEIVSYNVDGSIYLVVTLAFLCLSLSTACYFVTIYNLKNKLNLE